MNEEVIYIYTYTFLIEYYSTINKNEILPLSPIWMDLENIILSEISQMEKIKSTHSLSNRKSCDLLLLTPFIMAAHATRRISWL